MSTVNNCIWAIALIVFGALASLVYMKVSDPVDEPDPVCLPREVVIDHRGAVSAIETARDTLIIKSKTTPPEGVRAAYRDAANVLDHAVQMIERGGSGGNVPAVR